MEQQQALDKETGRFRPGRHYFLMRSSEFENFRDPDVFSPHMDLNFLRRVHGEFGAALEAEPDFAHSLEPRPELIPSAPYVVATRPERAARDLARRFLIHRTTKFEINILARSPTHFTIQYKRSWRQFGDNFSGPLELARNQVRFRGQPYTDDVHNYKRVEIPSLQQERVFIQFFRLEPTFQFYEYAAVIVPKQRRALRLPGWNVPVNEPQEYVSFDHKILVKSMFRPFKVKQGNNTFVVSANSARDAFQKARSELNNGAAQITISDNPERHRYINGDGKAQFRFARSPVLGNLSRRADLKRKRTHCTDNTFLFAKGDLRHVIHSSLRTHDLFYRELVRNVKNSIVKFKRMAQSTRLNDRMKESATFFLLKNRWFLIACAVLSDDDEVVNEILERAFGVLHARNPAVSTKQVTYESIRDDGPPLFDTMRDLLQGVDPNDNLGADEFVNHVQVDDFGQILPRDRPVPPSLGCAPAANQTQGPNMQIREGHDPFPAILLEGDIRATFAQWTGFLADYTRTFVLDKYVKAIRDDLPRIEKRQSVFGDYLQTISLEEENVPPVGGGGGEDDLGEDFWNAMEGIVHFGRNNKKKKNRNVLLYEKIMHSIF
jgi:hypothetical protein